MSDHNPFKVKLALKLEQGDELCFENSGFVSSFPVKRVELLEDSSGKFQVEVDLEQGSFPDVKSHVFDPNDFVIIIRP